MLYVCPKEKNTDSSWEGKFLNHGGHGFNILEKKKKKKKYWIWKEPIGEGFGDWDQGCCWKVRQKKWLEPN